MKSDIMLPAFIAYTSLSLHWGQKLSQTMLIYNIKNIQGVYIIMVEILPYLLSKDSMLTKIAAPPIFSRRVGSSNTMKQLKSPTPYWICIIGTTQHWQFESTSAGYQAIRGIHNYVIEQKHDKCVFNTPRWTVNLCNLCLPKLGCADYRCKGFCNGHKH